MTKVGCIGGGNIIRAILSGVEINKAYEKSEIGIFDISPQVCEEYKSKGYTIYNSIEDLIKGSEVVVVAVLPQIIRSIIPQIKGVYSDQNIFVSLPAGISNKWFYDNIGEDVKVVQCVPTLTAEVAMGAYAINRGEKVSDEDFKKVHHLLSNSGIIEEIPAVMMDDIVPFGGAAPAYFYHIADVVVREAVAMGFDETTVLRLFAQTMKGSAEMLLNAKISPKELEKKLLLPGAATLAAINKMEELGLDEALTEGIKACVAQCGNLGKL